MPVFNENQSNRCVNYPSAKKYDEVTEKFHDLNGDMFFTHVLKLDKENQSKK